MRYIVKIKEVGHPGVLISSIQGQEKTKEELVAFYGLNEPDVEWYEIYQEIDGKEVKL